MSTASNAMAKAGRPKKPMGEGSQVRIAPDVARMARLIARQQGMELGDYLTGILRARVNRDYAKMIRDLDAEGGEE